MAQYIGIVEDTLDPDFLGRIKCRVLGFHTQQNDDGSYIIGTDDLPWCRNGNMTSSGSASGGGAFSLPKLGTFVRIVKEDNYTYYYYDELYVSDEIKQMFLETPSDYQNAHVLLYDTCLGTDLDEKNKPTNYRQGEAIKVFYTDSKGFNIVYDTTQGSNTINIQPDGTVNIETSNGNVITIDNISDRITIKANDKITLDAENIELGENAAESVIKGDTFKALYNQHSHPTPQGLSGPPIVGLTTNCLSNKVKVK